MSTFDVSQLNNLFKQIDSVSGGTLGAKTIGNTGASYNDIAWFANAIATASASTEEATPEQKANAIKGMVEKAINVFKKIMEEIGNNENNVAKKEVGEQNKKFPKALRLSGIFCFLANVQPFIIQRNCRKKCPLWHAKRDGEGFFFKA